MTFPPPSFFLFKGRGATPIMKPLCTRQWTISSHQMENGNRFSYPPPPLKINKAISYDTSKNSTLIHTQVNPDNQECIQRERKWRRSIRFMARSLSVKFKCEFCTYTCIDMIFKNISHCGNFTLYLHTHTHTYTKNEYKSNTYTKPVLMFLSAAKRRSVTWHESFKWSMRFF